MLPTSYNQHIYSRSRLVGRSRAVAASSDMSYSVPHPSGDGNLELLSGISGFCKPGEVTLTEALNSVVSCCWCRVSVSVFACFAVGNAVVVVCRSSLCTPALPIPPETGHTGRHDPGAPLSPGSHQNRRKAVTREIRVGSLPTAHDLHKINDVGRFSAKRRELTVVRRTEHRPKQQPKPLISTDG